MPYRRRRYRRNKYNPGLAAALQHIEEARELSATLGGTDQDVKSYFFSLTQQQLCPILDAYETEYGSEKRRYAEQTIPKWKSGKTQMSGLVAGRLFDLLPSFMPLSKKFELVKSLWEKKCPSSHKTFFIGTEADATAVCNQVREHLTETVKNYKIPESIVTRFKWLAKNDVELQQKLYNYFFQLNREAVSKAADSRIPVLMNQLSTNRAVGQQLTQTIDVGNHQVALVFHSAEGGISTSRPPSASRHTTSNENSWGCVVAIIIGILLWILASNA
jgi:hypothetical protein